MAAVVLGYGFDSKGRGEREERASELFHHTLQ